MPNAKYFKYDEEYNLRPIYNDDVVEVVRCKNCKYNYLDPNNEKKCLKVDRISNPEFYCADGELAVEEEKEIVVKYIKADDVIDGMKKHNFMAKWMTIGDFVDSLPSANVIEVKHSEWVHREDMDFIDQNGVEHFHCMCENCGFVHDFLDCHTEQYNFCPECGIDMRGETK